jgi:hypothetical protein
VRQASYTRWRKAVGLKKAEGAERRFRLLCWSAAEGVSRMEEARGEESDLAQERGAVRLSVW